MRAGRIGVVARREWRTTVFRREFLLVTFGMPLLFGLIGGISAFGSFLAVSQAIRRAGSASQTVGLCDPGHVLNPAAFTAPLNGTRYRLIPRQEDGQAQVADGRLRALLLVSPDYLRTGRFTVYRGPSGGLFDQASSRQITSYAVALRAGVIWGRLPPDLTRRVLQPAGDSDPTVLQWDAKRRVFAAPNPIQSLSAFFVPYAFSLVLMMTIMLGTGYLLHGIVDEKESRVMEVLLSSVSHEELLRGKLLGLGGAGLTQLAVWLLLGGVPALVLLSRLPAALHIPPGLAALAVVLFVLGFAFYGSLMAGFGSLSSSWRESQQVTSVVAMSAVIPLMLMPAILEAPNSGLARALSWFPPTAPITLMLRASTENAPAWDLALGVALLALGIWAVQKVTAKLFRLGLLLYGKPPTPGEILRWLRAA